MENEDVLLKASEFYKSLADFSRLKILYTILRNKELCVSEIISKVKMTQTAVSYQLKALKEVNLIKCNRRGKHIIYEINDEHINEIICLTLAHMEED